MPCTLTETRTTQAISQRYGKLFSGSQKWWSSFMLLLPFRMNHDETVVKIIESIVQTYINIEDVLILTSMFTDAGETPKCMLEYLARLKEKIPFKSAMASQLKGDDAVPRRTRFESERVCTGVVVFPNDIHCWAPKTPKERQ